MGGEVYLSVVPIQFFPNVHTIPIGIGMNSQNWTGVEKNETHRPRIQQQQANIIIIIDDKSYNTHSQLLVLLIFT